MSKIYITDEDFIGKQVVLRMCEFHEDCEPAAGYTRKEVSLTGNCNCKLKGRTVTVTGLKQTSRARFYRSTCYTIAESKNLVHESEFSSEKQTERPGITAGYIIEGAPNYFITAEFNYAKKTSVIEGYIHNTGVIKDLLKAEWTQGFAPTKAYPAKYDWRANVTKIVGESLSWEQLREKVLVR